MIKQFKQLTFLFLVKKRIGEKEKYRKSFSTREGVSEGILGIYLTLTFLVLLLFIFSTTAQAQIVTDDISQVPDVKYGIYPDCIAPAVGIENHGWWHENGPSASKKEEAPRHIHIASCLPNARPDGSVSVKKGENFKFIDRIMMYNNPSTINLVRWQWQGSTKQNVPVALKCTPDVKTYTLLDGRPQCTWWVELTFEPPSGTNELRTTPNIRSHVDLGKRQYSTLNFQIKSEGSSGSYRNSTAPIGRAWYPGSSYVNVVVNYMELFKPGENNLSVPIVSGTVTLHARHHNQSGSGAKSQLWLDMDHHLGPTFYLTAKAGDKHPSGGVLLYSNPANWEGDYAWDTTLVPDGRHVLYFQSQETNSSGVNAGALALFVDVCNNPPGCSGGGSSDGGTGGGAPILDPKLTITSPAPSATVEGSDVTIRFEAQIDAVDQNTNYHTHFSLDNGTDAIVALDVGQYIFRNVAPGTHTIRGYLAHEDHSKVIGTDTEVIFISATGAVDTVAPQALILEPASGATISENYVIQVSGTDNRGIESVSFYLDGVLVGTDTVGSGANNNFYSHVLETDTVVDGTHTVRVVVKDFDGNQTSKEVAITVDNTTLLQGLLNIFILPLVEGRQTPVGKKFLVKIYGLGDRAPVETFSNLEPGEDNELEIPQNTLIPGSYDIRVSSSHHLSRRISDVFLDSGAKISIPSLFAGDLNNDGIINSLDWSVMNPLWFSSDNRGDINGDILVNAIDFSYLASNWGNQSDPEPLEEL